MTRLLTLLTATLTISLTGCAAGFRIGPDRDGNVVRREVVIPSYHAGTHLGEPVALHR